MPAVVAAVSAGLVLALDAALGGCLAALVRDGVVVAERRVGGGRGSSAALPAMVAEVLGEGGVGADALGGVAVTVGPGSFTGVRAALALAHGIGLGGGAPVWGVTVGGAIRAGVDATRPVWVAVDSKRGRVFLDDEVTAVAVGLDALPAPAGAVAIAGDAAIAVVSRLAARGYDVQLLAAREPTAVGVAAGARVAALPLYVDPPEARAGPAGRPAPG